MFSNFLPRNCIKWMNYSSLILKNKTHVLGLFDPVLKNDAFAGSMPMKVAYIFFGNSRHYNFLT